MLKKNSKNSIIFSYVFEKSDIDQVYNCFTDIDILNNVGLANDNIKYKSNLIGSKLDLERSSFNITQEQEDLYLAIVDRVYNSETYKSFSQIIYKIIPCVNRETRVINSESEWKTKIKMTCHFYFNTCDNSTLFLLDADDPSDSLREISREKGEIFCLNINNYLKNTLINQTQISSIVINRPMKQVWKVISDITKVFNVISNNKFQFTIENNERLIGTVFTIYYNESDLKSVYTVKSVEEDKESMMIRYEQEQNFKPKINHILTFNIIDLSEISCLLNLNIQWQYPNQGKYLRTWIKWSKCLLIKIKKKLEMQCLNLD